MREPIPDGASALHLVDVVAFLREDAAVFEAMLEGWTAQQVGGRRLQPETAADRLRVVRRFQQHAQSWPGGVVGRDAGRVDAGSRLGA